MCIEDIPVAGGAARIGVEDVGRIGEEIRADLRCELDNGDIENVSIDGRTGRGAGIDEPSDRRKHPTVLRLGDAKLLPVEAAQYVAAGQTKHTPAKRDEK
jgi:hypothetical protein